MITLNLHVNDMHCAACTQKITRVLNDLRGISDVRFNPVRKQVLISHSASLDQSHIIARIENAGFNPTVKESLANKQPDEQQLLLRLGIAGLALMQIMMAQGGLYAGYFSSIDAAVARLLSYTALIFSIPVVCYCAMPFFRKGLGSLSTGVNMDTPIALAIAIAFSASLVSTLTNSGETYYDSVAMFTFLMLGARYIDAQLRSRISLQDELLESLPKTVVRLTDGSMQHKTTVAIDKLAVDDILWIAEGEQLPADGVLVDNRCLIDEALFSGESDWKSGVKHQKLFTGTFNRGAAFRMKVTKLPQFSRLAEIEHLATNALADKHRLARLADQIAGWFIPAIFAISAITVVVWFFVQPDKALTAGLAVLIVSCPCALSLATPTALSAAMTRLRSLGVLVKSDRPLEIANRVSHIVFDKTGTLASPTVGIQGIQNLSCWTTKWCTSAASALQIHSSHPLANAFGTAPETIASDVQVAQAQGLSGVVDGRQVRIGSAEFCGMQHLQRPGPGKQVYLCVNDQPAAIFDLVEQPRADAASTLNALQRQGLTLELLSGDKPANCRRLAAPLNLKYLANQTPEQKYARMQVLKEQASNRGRSLMYVGDGMNDIPALAAADLSVATLETNELVKSKADVVLLTQRLSALQDLLTTGSSCHKILRQNLLWALAYNLVAIPWAASGSLPPWAAALGMSLSSIIVLLNSSRLLKTKSVASPAHPTSKEPASD